MVLVVMAGLLACYFSGAAAQEERVDFTGSKQFSFGMEEDKANSLLEDTDDWEIAYKIKTPTTMDVVCRYKEQLYFQARFFEGRCFFLEKRAEADLEEVSQVFEHYFDEFGESPEATQSSDGRLFFARWEKDGRETMLTADMRSNGNYILTFEDMLPELIGQANHVQEREISEMPSDVDPVTGNVRRHVHKDDDSEKK